MESKIVNLGQLFDRVGRLIPIQDLPPDVAEQVAAFEIVRVTTRVEGEAITTEELIRVRLRDRRAAMVGRRGGDRMSRGVLARRPLRRALVTTMERLVGSGRTATADEQAQS